MTRHFTDIGSEDVTYMYTMEQSDYNEDISSDQKHHEQVEKKETNIETNIEAAVVPGPSEKPSDNGLMMVDVVPPTSREAAPVTERSHQEERADDGDDERANDGHDQRANADPVTVVSTVNVRMQRRTVVYPNGFVDVMRTTDYF